MSEYSTRWSSTLRRRVALAVAVMLLAVTVVGSVAFGGPARPAPRLEGAWKVSLTFTAAEHVVDRQVGQETVESWMIRPQCKEGACNAVLHRGNRRLLLRRAGTRYTGKGSFTGPFFCKGRTYPRGTAYVETWTVRVRRGGPGPRGRRAIDIAGVGATVGRSQGDLPCVEVVSLEGVEFRGVPLRR
jgi:hypothetical protein